MIIVARIWNEAAIAHSDSRVLVVGVDDRVGRRTAREFKKEPPVLRREVFRFRPPAERGADRLHRQRVQVLSELRVRHLGAIDAERLDRHAVLRHRGAVRQWMLLLRADRVGTARDAHHRGMLPCRRGRGLWAERGRLRKARRRRHR